MTSYDAPELVDDKTHTEQLDLDEGLSFPSTYAVLGLCQLNQWALDFDGNLRRIVRSIESVKRLGGYYRLGPELEVSGYSCDDHFNEFDTTVHCWQSICQILRSDLSNNCLLDIGMPVEHKSVRYNCRVYILNQRVILIRPKMFLAQDGAYRETRWFGAWSINSEIETFVLPKSVQRVIKQKTCPIGFAAIQCNDCIIAAESCEELFVPESPHLAMCLGGVDVFCNGSASYFEIRKLGRRLDLIMAPTQKMGGVYMYCNMKGNDGGKSLFDGNSFIACNGAIVNMISPMALDDVEVMVERVNISSVRSYRACNPSYAVQAACKPVPCIAANIWLSGVDDSSVSTLRLNIDKSSLAAVTLPDLPEELARNIACWLWDYLRRSRAQGFIVATSGGADSGAVASLVRVVCDLVMEARDRGVKEVVTDLENVLRMNRDDPAFPTDSRSLCYQLLHTCYLGMAHTSGETRKRARDLANDLGSYHLELDVDEVVSSQVGTVSRALGFAPRFQRTGGSGGSRVEDIALQNTQARSRMVSTYLIAALLPTLRAKDRLAPPPTKVTQPADFPVLSDEEAGRVGFLLSLATGNIDETLRGYFTKYDCSSGDLGPIGSLSKVHLRILLDWIADRYKSEAVRKILAATPTAELRPQDEISGAQEDETEMGLTYEELFLLGNMRKCERCGPVEMYELLVQRWKLQTPSVNLGDRSPSRVPKPIDSEEAAMESLLSDPDVTARKIAEKVKHFFRTYSQNRHKTTTLPPSLHVEGYDPENSRHDWRPFLYPSWDRQFRQIDKLVALAEEKVEIASCDNAVPHKKTMWFGGLPGGAK